MTEKLLPPQLIRTT